MKQTTHILIVADERRAASFTCEPQGQGRWRLVPSTSMENRWADYHEHHRPSSLGRGPTANASQHFAACGHEDEEEHARFGKEVAAWLNQLRVDHRSKRPLVLTPARFLGVLRRELGPDADGFDLRRGEFTRIPAHELGTHPAILEALGPGVASIGS